METKHLDVQLDIKSVNDDGFFSGYGSVSGNKDSYGDVVMRGAFTKTLNEWQTRGRLPPVLFNHDWDMPIGFFTKLVEDDRGLYVEGQLLIKEIEKAREVHALLRAKAIDGLSIGFQPVQKEHDRKTDVTKLLEVKLYEISIVIFPANPEARVNCVKFEHGLPSSEEFKEILRQNGFNEKQAAVIHDGGFLLLSQKAAPEQHNSVMNDVIQILRGN